MKELVKLVILSHKRPRNVVTYKTIANCSICVPEDQYEEYKQSYPKAEFIVHPTSVVGLSAKMKWLHKEIPNVVMLDDDLNAMVRNYIDSNSSEGNKILPEEAYELIQANAYLAKQLGAKFFGFSNSAAPVNYNPMQPIKLSGFVIGGSFGFLEGFKLENLPDECISAQDYFCSALSAYYHRLTVIDTRFAFTSKEGTFTSSGGMSDLRTKETEKNDYLLLKKYFGDCIVKKTASAIREVAHSYERSFVQPW